MDSKIERRRGGGPALAWVVAAALWAVTMLVDVLSGEYPMSAPRALLYAAVCVGVGAWTAVIAAALNRFIGLVAFVVVAGGSQLGLGYLDTDLAVSGGEVAVVVGVSTVVFLASRALADQLAAS